jgi:hypothetical protein
MIADVLAEVPSGMIFIAHRHQLSWLMHRDGLQLKSGSSQILLNLRRKQSRNNTERMQNGTNWQQRQQDLASQLGPPVNRPLTTLIMTHVMKMTLSPPNERSPHLTLIANLTHLQPLTLQHISMFCDCSHHQQSRIRVERNLRKHICSMDPFDSPLT